MRNLVRGLVAALALTLVIPAQADQAKAAELRQAGQAALQSGDLATAADSFGELTRLDPKDGQAWLLYGFALHGLKKLDAALAAHLKASEFPAVKPIATYNVACVHALRNDKDKAFAWLDKAVAAGFANIEHVNDDADMDSLRDDPRFKATLAAMEAAATKGSAQPQVFVATTERQNLRYFLYGSPKIKGQFSVDYGPVTWKDEYAKFVAKHQEQSPRWRFGQDFWTTFDTNLPLEIGGTTLQPGAYYLTLEVKDGKFVVAFNDPAAIRKQQLDAFRAEKTSGGIPVVFAHTETKEPAAKLTFLAERAPDDATKGVLKVRFGPHELSAAFALRLEK